MPIIEDVAIAMQTVLNLVAYDLGRETGFVQRDSKLNGASFVQTMVFSYLADPNASLSDLTQTAAAIGVDITPAGLTQRFTEAAATLLQRVLAAAVQRVLAADPLAIPILERFAGVYLEDSTVVTLPDAMRDLWPGCGNGTEHGTAALKVNLRLDLTTGVLADMSLHAGRVHDSKAAQALEPLTAGALYLADLGYFSLERLRKLADQDAFFLVRLQAQTTVFDAAGRRWDDVAALLATQDEHVDLPVTLGVPQRLPTRLVAVRVPQEVADQRRRKLRAEARRKGQAVSARRLALAGWTIFVTNVPADLLPLKAAVVVARARWQIELSTQRVPELWKSHGRIDESRSTRKWRVVCDVYAKLLAMILQHWVALLSLWGYPDRSLVKAAKTVQKYALQLASFVWHCSRTMETLETIARCLLAGCRMGRRRKHPNTYQLLLAVTELP
jgi:hypothetical protein